MHSLQTYQENRQPIGTLVEVHGPVVIIDCTQLPPLRQALCTCFDHTTYLFEVHQHLDERHIRAITLHGSAGLSRGMTVFDTGAPLRIPVSDQCLGRLLNIFGEPLDGQSSLPQTEFRNIHAKPLPLSEAIGMSGILETGYRGLAISDVTRSSRLFQQ